MKFIVSCALLLSVPAFAQQWSGNTSIEQIYPHSTNNTDGTIYFMFEKMINPGGCSKSNLIALKRSNKLSSEIYAIMLSSAVSGKKVSYYIVGCDAHGYPELRHALVNF
jgi:hypothetical protein